MSHIHVLVKTKKTDDWVCVFKDLSVSQLRKKVVKPYKLGKSIFHDGNILLSTDISQIKIVGTERSHSDELKFLREDHERKVSEFNRSSSGITFISLGRGRKDYEIKDCGQEVTSSYISSGPGTGTFLSVLSDFIKHPLVVRIPAGLVLMAIAAYLGFR